MRYISSKKFTNLAKEGFLDFNFDAIANYCNRIKRMAEFALAKVAYLNFTTWKNVVETHNA